MKKAVGLRNERLENKEAKINSNKKQNDKQV